jgi:hypothetical protein
VLVLLDGDQKKVDEFTNPDDIPTAQNDTLEDLILSQVGVRPDFSIDGGAGGGNLAQRVAAQRTYLGWVCKNLAYLPTSSPEELVLRAAAEIGKDEKVDTQACKGRLQKLASNNLGTNAGNDDTDAFGKFLLGVHRAKSDELKEIAKKLITYLATLKPAATV